MGYKYLYRHYILVVVGERSNVLQERYLVGTTRTSTFIPTLATLHRYILPSDNVQGSIHTSYVAAGQCSMYSSSLRRSRSTSNVYVRTRCTSLAVWKNMSRRCLQHASSPRTRLAPCAPCMWPTTASSYYCTVHQCMRTTMYIGDAVDVPSAFLRRMVSCMCTHT